jgi:hypothetical protein
MAIRVIDDPACPPRLRAPLNFWTFLNRPQRPAACTAAAAGTVMADIAEGNACKVAADIERYLRAHPDAADTLDGAARWWLPREPSREVMEQAMAMLVSQEIVERHVLPEGTTVFRCGPGLRPSDN